METLYLELSYYNQMTTLNSMSSFVFFNKHNIMQIEETILSKLIELINQHDEKEITRQKILNDLLDGYRTTTLDNYRNYLTKAKYLETISRGRYRILRQIPVTLTTTQLYDEAYQSR